jgi:hypothetical protein
MKPISTEQHQMLEDLTGLQHTRTGAVRRQQTRSRYQTLRLGLRDPDAEWVAKHWPRLRKMLAGLRPTITKE